MIGSMSRRPHLLSSSQRAYAPVRQHDPEIVTPLGVFVARRGHFDAIVRERAVASLALETLFRELPLAALGWQLKASSVKRLGASADGFPIWHVTRPAV